jgi:hypothetical protein
MGPAAHFAQYRDVQDMYKIMSQNEPAITNGLHNHGNGMFDSVM